MGLMILAHVLIVVGSALWVGWSKLPLWGKALVGVGLGILISTGIWGSWWLVYVW
jgi:hypothetical protein